MADFPEYQRSESIQPGSGVQNFGDATREAAAAEWKPLSQIGAEVAQSASTQIAVSYGYQMGQDPKGDMLPPITDFDKHVTESYNSQAQATLSLRANKMMMDADSEVNQASRITPDLIAKTKQQMSQGLLNILGDAPTAVKTQLGYTFTNQLMTQTYNYQNKMIAQQKEDQKNNLVAALNDNARLASEFSMAGNQKAADDLAERSKSMAKAGVSTNSITPDQANVASQTVADAAVNGKFINQAVAAKNSGNFEKWAKDFADADPKSLGITYAQKQAASNQVLSHIATLDALKSQDENLRSARMVNSIAEDVTGVTGSMMQDFKENVSPLKYEEMKLRYINAVKSQSQKGNGIDGVIQNFSSPETFARATEKEKNGAFDKLISYTQEKSKNGGTPISQEDAEVQIAASAGGTIPAFVNGLTDKLASANPNYIESAAQQVHKLQAMGAGHALVGLSDQSKALYTKYEALRDSLDPTTAAREATDAVYNQDPDTERMNKEKWSSFLTTSLQGGTPPDKFALSQVGFKTSDFVNPGTAQVYGTNILQKYGTYFQLLNGDRVSALKLTKQFVDDNYGHTGVNGGSNVTLHPLEKVLGYSDKDVVPYIQGDVMNQLNEKFQPIKQLYADKKTNEYWEVVPNEIKDKAHFFGHDYPPVKIKRHTRVGNKETTDMFDVVLQGNAFDNWDVSINSPTGMRNLFQIAPYLGVSSYVPNKKAIDAAYLKAHPL